MSDKETETDREKVREGGRGERQTEKGRVTETERHRKRQHSIMI